MSGGFGQVKLGLNAFLTRTTFNVNLVNEMPMTVRFFGAIGTVTTSV